MGIINFKIYIFIYTNEQNISILEFFLNNENILFFEFLDSSTLMKIQIYQVVLENLGPLSFKFHHNMIDPLHAIPSSLFL
jgi:hypothetical protein